MNQQSSQKGMSKRRAVVVSAVVLVVVIAIITWLKSFPQSEKSVQSTEVKQAQRVDELLQKLQLDSRRGMEYFNSQAYDSLVNVPRLQSDASPLAARIIEPNRRYLLTLLVLRKVAKITSYEQLDNDLKIGILIDALNQAVYFNAWGLPHLYSEEASRPEPVQAIIELGDDAYERLEPLLGQKRRAPRWGSEEGARDGEYDYRVADYAIALRSEIKGKQFPDRAERDRIINEYLAKWKRR